LGVMFSASVVLELHCAITRNLSCESLARFGLVCGGAGLAAVE
jgi:hypothetical protein